VLKGIAVEPAAHLPTLHIIFEAGAQVIGFAILGGLGDRLRWVDRGSSRRGERINGLHDDHEAGTVD
jgi:hypothetical protein